MIIQQKFIRLLESHLYIFSKGTNLILGVNITSGSEEKLKRIGFPIDWKPGDAVLPSFRLGRFCRFNAEGKFIKHKDQPMETDYYPLEWHWIERHGNKRVEKSDIRYRSYQRYPRTFIKPPSIELQIVRKKNNQLLLVSPTFSYVESDYKNITTAINVFLEIFGLCEVFTGDLEEINDIPTRRVNWEILPPGKYPWERVQKIIEPILQEAKPGNRLVIENRIQTVESYSPEFRVLGHAGFKGYIIHGFPQKHIFILESAYFGNATYVFDDDWEKFSKLSKAEILDESLQKERLIHREGWHNNIRKLFQ
jgi:hypothetical protein